MGKINEDYANLTGVASGDLLPIVDVSDLSMSASGTTKHTAVSSLASAVAQFPAGGTPPLTSTGFYISEFANIAGWTCDPALIGGAVVPASGTVYVSKVRAVLPTAATLACYIGANAGTLTTGQCFMSLVACSGDGGRAAGVQVGVTADQASAWGTVGVRQAALAGGPYAITVGAYYWICMLMNWTVTGTSWARNQLYTGALANFGMNGTGQMRFGQNVAGQTSIPSPLVPASNVAQGNEWWAAVLAV